MVADATVEVVGTSKHRDDRRERQFLDHGAHRHRVDSHDDAGEAQLGFALCGERTAGRAALAWKSR